MTLETAVRDLERVLAADIFDAPAGTGTPAFTNYHQAAPVLFQMQEMIKRDTRAIQRTRDATGIDYKRAAWDWSDAASFYLSRRKKGPEPLEFNRAYEVLLSWYAGRVMDEVLLLSPEEKNTVGIPPTVLKAQRRVGLYSSRNHYTRRRVGATATV